MSIKIQHVIIILAIGSLTVMSVSVTGLLQSTERISSSGIIVRPVQNPIIIIPPETSSPPPPEPEIEIDVYVDSECTQILSDVTWGEIEAGQESNVEIYLKNDGDVGVTISILTENWSSSTAQENIDLSWNNIGTPLQSGEVRNLILTLSVDPDCPELSSFSFDIVIIGS